MDGEAALDRLPRRYGLALRLQALGAGPELIAECLELELSAVAALLVLADAKLADLGGAIDTST